MVLETLAQSLNIFFAVSEVLVREPSVASGWQCISQLSDRARSNGSHGHFTTISRIVPPRIHAVGMK